MATGVLKIATCQFGVTADIEHNAQKITSLASRAAEGGADVVHFSECALSGYASVDFENLDRFDWELLKKETREIMALAAKLKIWVVLGSCHRLGAPNKPHNSLYLINPDGKVEDRYDKRFCTEIDLANYTPGNHFANFDINGVKCSLLICFDLRFPEIYRALCKEGVQCIFQSFYNAAQNAPSVHTHIMPQSMQCRAATNYFWVSMANSCRWYCPYPSCFIQPDGRISGKLADHREGLMINTVDTSQQFYDPSAPFRDMAIAGKLTNATSVIDDRRSTDRAGI